MPVLTQFIDVTGTRNGLSYTREVRQRVVGELSGLISESDRCVMARVDADHFRNRRTALRCFCGYWSLCDACPKEPLTCEACGETYLRKDGHECDKGKLTVDSEGYGAQLLPAKPKEEPVEYYIGGSGWHDDCQSRDYYLRNANGNYGFWYRQGAELLTIGPDDEDKPPDSELRKLKPREGLDWAPPVVEEELEFWSVDSWEKPAYFDGQFCAGSWYRLDGVLIHIGGRCNAPPISELEKLEIPLEFQAQGNWLRLGRGDNIIRLQWWLKGIQVGPHRLHGKKVFDD